MPLSLSIPDCDVPQNIAPLQVNGFIFSLQRLPELTYFCQSVTIPTVSLPAPTQATPFVQYPLPGDHLQFAPLEISYLVDNSFINHTRLFSWLQGVGFPDNHQQYIDERDSTQFTSLRKNENVALMSDATVTILGNASQNLCKINFIDCIVTSVGSLGFTTSNADVQYLTASASFEYTSYTFEMLPG